MDTNEITRTCENCKNFIRHYIWKDKRYRISSFGHCTARNNYSMDYNRQKACKNCKFWEEKIQNDRNEMSIWDTLTLITILLRQVQDLVKNNK